MRRPADRAARFAVALMTVALLAVALLAGCGAEASAPTLDEALALDLPGFVAAAPRPEPANLCDPDPRRPDASPPGIPADLLEPVSAFYEQAASTVEIYAWRTPDGTTATAVLDEARAATAGCGYEASMPADTDGDGVPDASQTDRQVVQPWIGSDFTGIRMVRTVSGQEQVDRQFVRVGDVFLLVVLRADSDDPADAAVAGTVLQTIADRIA